MHATFGYIDSKSICNGILIRLVSVSRSFATIQKQLVGWSVCDYLFFFTCCCHRRHWTCEQCYGANCDDNLFSDASMYVSLWQTRLLHQANLSLLIPWYFFADFPGLKLTFSLQFYCGNLSNVVSTCLLFRTFHRKY